MPQLSSSWKYVFTQLYVGLFVRLPTGLPAAVNTALKDSEPLQQISFIMSTICGNWHPRLTFYFSQTTHLWPGQASHLHDISYKAWLNLLHVKTVGNLNGNRAATELRGGKQPCFVEPGLENTDTWKSREAVDTANKMITHFTAISGSCSHNHFVDSLPVCRCAHTDGFMKIH